MLPNQSRRTYHKRMSLTKGDLQAIKGIVEDAKEDIKIDVAAGFAEVHKQFAEVHQKIDQSVAYLGEKIDHVDSKLSVKDRKLENTVERIDELEIQGGQTKNSPCLDHLSNLHTMKMLDSS